MRHWTCALFVAAVVALPGSSRAATAAKLHPYDYLPTWSRDGTHLAFSREWHGELAEWTTGRDGKHRRRIGGGPASWGPRGELVFALRGDVYVARADGSGRRQLTFGRDADSEPEWSPDGRTIAFARSSPDVRRSDVWRMDSDGGHAYALTSDGHSYFEQTDTAWSPDSSRVAFMRCVGRKCLREALDVFVVAAKGGKPRRLTWSGDNNSPAWSPDGRWIAFYNGAGRLVRNTSDAEIFVVRPDGRGRRNVSQSKRLDVQLGGNVSGLTWSPDGRWIAFDADNAGITPPDGVGEGITEIFVVRPNGTGAHPLLRDRARRSRAQDHRPAWSPNGKEIAFARLYGQPGERGALYGSILVVRRDGTHLRRLTY